MVTPGKNSLVLGRGRYGNRATTMVFQSPLRIFEVGQPKGEEAAQFVLATYGGGMVQGDQIHLEIHAGLGSKSVIHSQANSHILKNDTGANTVFSVDATLETGAELIFAVEPTVLHSQGRFHQKQHWKLHSGAKLVLLDWFQSGRSESGETYKFTHYHNELTLTLDDQDILVENFIFEPPRHDHRNAASLGGMDHMATVYMVGDFDLPLEDLLKLPEAQEEKRKFRPLEHREDSPAHTQRTLQTSLYRVGSCLVLRILAPTRSTLEPFLGKVLSLVQEQLGGYPTSIRSPGRIQPRKDLPQKPCFSQ